MPVTFSPATHAAETFDPEKFLGPSTKEKGGLAVRILEGACFQQHRQLDELLQSSFDSIPTEEASDHSIVPMRNGFVDTVLRAYNHHHALIIRPDDVWLAILVQFSSFINANAEEIRSHFVRHEGKKELIVKADRNDVDYATLANMLTTEIEKNIVDPSLRAWVLPNFTTTTSNDTAVCSVVMMASMKKYFDYKMCLMCGIPRVTLEGEKEDWEKILARLEKLKEYGLQTMTWYHLLRPIILRFAQAFDTKAPTGNLYCTVGALFDTPNAKENLDFWQRVAHYRGGGSGPRYLCGWITAFCVFGDDGQWLGEKIKGDVKELSDARSLSAKDFFSTYINVSPPPTKSDPFGRKSPSLELDDTRYHIIDSADVPCGYSEVDVLLDDDGVEYQCMMVAGTVAMRFRSSEGGSGPGVKDSVEPVPGWWMFTKKSAAQVEAEDPRQPYNTLFPGLAKMREQTNDSEEVVKAKDGSDTKIQRQKEPQKDIVANCCHCLVM